MAPWSDVDAALARGDLPAAIAGVQAAAAAGAPDWELARLAARLDAAGGAAAAEDLLSPRVRPGRPVGDAHRTLGRLRAERGELAFAEPLLAACWQASGTVADANNLAALLHADGRPAEAIAVLGPALARAAAPAPVAWNTLGACFLDTGDVSAARSALARALAQDRDQPEVWRNLALTFQPVADADTLRPLLAEALARAPAHAGLRLVAAAAALAWGEVQRIPGLVDGLPAAAAGAVRAIEAVAHLAGPRPLALFHTADTLRAAVARARRPGVVVELGVRFGASARILLDAGASPFVGFDSFAGLPEAWHGVPRGAYSTRGQQPALGPAATLVPGWFASTVPAWVGGQAAPLRLVHIDCDLHSSTRDALDALAPLIAPGTVLAFDDYFGNPHWEEDEHRAFLEVAQRHGWRWEARIVSLPSGQFVVEITSVSR